MAACGVVCMQEFGQYDDWRIFKSMEFVNAAITRNEKARSRDGRLPFDPYTMYYVGQALYQVGGTHWQEGYPILRDQLIASQISSPATWTTASGFVRVAIAIHTHTWADAMVICMAHPSLVLSWRSRIVICLFCKKEKSASFRTSKL